MKKLLVLSLCFALVGCTSDSQNDPKETITPNTSGQVETFDAEYEMVGTTSSGNPKNDTFIFKGETTDGIITSLEFDVIRNKGLEGEYSKTDIMGYMMNVSDASVETVEGNITIQLSAMGYTVDAGQYLNYATLENATVDATFKDLTILDYKNNEITDEAVKLSTFSPIAKEAGIELTNDTLLTDLLAQYNLVKDGTFVDGTLRISFEGIAGGRSYGEQIQAIETYILENNMTLEDVYTMFKTVNQADEDIASRDTISGASITFVGDFQRMVYVAMHGELFKGVVNTTEVDGGTKYEVVTQGYGGEIETHVTIDASGNVTAIVVRDSNETDTFGAVLTKENSDYINSLLTNQADLTKVDTKVGSTVTATALLEAVEFAKEANSTKE